MILHPKILIISSVERHIQQLEKLLEGCDFQLAATPDVLSAMAVLKTETIDLVILDDNPAEFNITDAVRILKCLMPNDHLPVLCLVRAANPTERAAMLDSGADDYLIDLPDRIELQARLRKLLSIRMLHQQFTQNRRQLEGALTRESQLLRQLRNDNRQLKQRSITDGLTSLYNHRYLMEWLKTEFKIARRYGHPISFIMADLDHFKQVNDKYGHPFGDYVLKEIAVILKSCARESDLVARYGGEEFAVVLPRGDRQTAALFAERFRTAVAEREFDNGHHRLKLTVSLGMSTYPLDAEITSPEILVYLADQALLHSKQTGRNKLVGWHEMAVQQRAKLRRQLAGGEIGELGRLRAQPLPIQAGEFPIIDPPDDLPTGGTGGTGGNGGCE